MSTGKKISFFILSVLLLAGIPFFGQQKINADSLIAVWKKNGIPPGREKDYQEYELHKEELAKNKHTHAHTHPHNEKTAAALDPCTNPGLELGNFQQWGRYTGSANTTGAVVPNGAYGGPDYSATNNVSYNSAVNSGSQFIIHSMPGGSSNTSGVGYDPHSFNGAVYTIPQVSPNAGGNFSARLNNSTAGGKAAKMDYYFTVSPLNPTFEFNYALVIEDGNHQNGEQAAFSYRFIDYNTGNVLPIAGTSYQTNATYAQSDPAFAQDQSSSGSDAYYKQWTHVVFDMCNFVGTNIKVEFEALDCIFGGHYSYAYIDLSCGARSVAAQSGNCDDSTNFKLTVSPGMLSYQWMDPQGGQISAAQTGTQNTLDLWQYIANCPTGNCTVNDGDVFTVQVVTAAGCTLYIPLTVNVNEVNVTSIVTQATCKEGSNGAATVNVNGGMGPGTYNYSWYASPCTGPVISSINSITNQVAGDYCLHVSSGDCPPADTVVKIPLLPMDVLQQSITLECLDSAYVLSADASASSYQWYANAAMVAGAVTNQLAIDSSDYSIPYSVTYLDSADGCKDSMNYTLNFSGGGAMFNAVYCPNDSLVFVYMHAAGAQTSFQWYLDTVMIAGATDDTLGFIPQENLSASNLVFYNGSCKQKAENFEQIFPDEIFIPDTTTNIFTPNGDGTNDLFSPYVNKVYSLQEINEETDSYELLVFNRWGNLVYKTTTVAAFWNGNNIFGQPENEGTYFWIASFQSNCTDEGKVVKKGYVQLIR